MLVDLRVGDDVVHISYEEFQIWVREGRIPDSLPVRYPPLTGAEFVAASDLELFQALRDDVAARVIRRFSLHRFAPVSAGLAVACLALFAAMAATAVGDGLPAAQAAVQLPVDVLVGWGAKEPARVQELGEWWRLLAGVLLHAGVLHLLPNVAYIAYVGWNVENVYGSAGTAVILASAAAAGSAASLLGTGAPSVGASGVTCGLFAAAVVFGWRFGVHLPGLARRKFGWQFFPFLAFFLVLGLKSPVVDNWSHVGGCVGGGLAAMFLLPWLVQAESEGGARARGRAWTAVGLLAVPLVLSLPPVAGAVSSVMPRLAEVHADPRAGWAFRVPAYWRSTLDRFGAAAFASPTRREAVAWRARELTVADLPPSAGTLVAELSRDGGSPLVATGPEQGDRRVGDHGWGRVRLVVDTADGPWEVERYTLDREGWRYALTFEHPVRDAGTTAVLRDRILSSVRFDGHPRPEGLTRARSP